jgi:hypothetical protein
MVKTADFEDTRALASLAVENLRLEWADALEFCTAFASRIIPQEYDKGNVLEVCIRGDIPALQALIDLGTDIRKNNDEAIFYAAENGRFEMIGFLIERGAPLARLSPQSIRYYDNYKEAKLLVAKEMLQADQSLAAIFNAQTWVGHVPEMRALWSQVPEPLQSEFDFQHVLSVATVQTMKLKKPKVSFTK